VEHALACSLNKQAKACSTVMELLADMQPPVGQAGILRPIAYRPSCSEVQLTEAPIANRRQAASPAISLPHNAAGLQTTNDGYVTAGR
jgi:hypothetical protein